MCAIPSTGNFRAEKFTTHLVIRKVNNSRPGISFDQSIVERGKEMGSRKGDDIRTHADGSEMLRESTVNTRTIKFNYSRHCERRANEEVGRQCVQ